MWEADTAARTVHVVDVVKMLDVRLARRPWRRRRLRRHELGQVERALAAGGWTLMQPTVLPRRLSARVTIVQTLAWTPLVLSLQAAMFDRLSGCCQVAATSRGVR
jgi:hypothetical protein